MMLGALLGSMLPATPLHVMFHVETTPAPLIRFDFLRALVISHRLSGSDSPGTGEALRRKMGGAHAPCLSTWSGADRSSGPPRPPGVCNGQRDSGQRDSGQRDSGQRGSGQRASRQPGSSGRDGSRGRRSSGNKRIDNARIRYVWWGGWWQGDVFVGVGRWAGITAFHPLNFIRYHHVCDSFIAIF